VKKQKPMVQKNNRITTIKLETKTKDRLEKLREHKRETYDDIIRKILYVLNMTREDPNKSKAILEFIDEKRRRMFETEKRVVVEKKRSEDGSKNL
jgi:hypothetical protein